MTTIAKPAPASVRTTPRFSLQNPAFRRNLEGWLFASPWILGFLLWTLGPMIASLLIAFTEWDLISAPQWVGLANLTAMFNDKLVAQSLWVTTIYAVVSVPLHLIFGLGLALLLNTKIVGLRFYRTAFYLPSVLSGVAPVAVARGGRQRRPPKPPTSLGNFWPIFPASKPNSMRLRLGPPPPHACWS